jgi:hypothetical protein
MSIQKSEGGGEGDENLSVVEWENILRGCTPLHARTPHPRKSVYMSKNLHIPSIAFYSK